MFNALIRLGMLWAALMTGVLWYVIIFVDHGIPSTANWPFILGVILAPLGIAGALKWVFTPHSMRQ